MAHAAHHNTKSRTEAAWYWTGDLPATAEETRKAIDDRMTAAFGIKRKPRQSFGLRK